MMTTDFARLEEQATVSDALSVLATQAADLETIYYMYVVDKQDHLRGVLSARDLVWIASRNLSLQTKYYPIPRSL